MTATHLTACRIVARKSPTATPIAKAVDCMPASAAHQLLSLLLTAACLALAAASDDAKSIVMVEADPYVPLDTEKHLAALDDSDVWLVEFFSPMCGSCTDFKSTWAEVASALNGQVCIGIL